jgi:hypothetical protein
MSVKEFGKTPSRESFREIMVRGKSYWVHTMILSVNKLGRVRVVVCYDNEELGGAPVYLVYEQTPLGRQKGWSSATA